MMEEKTPPALGPRAGRFFGTKAKQQGGRPSANSGPGVRYALAGTA